MLDSKNNEINFVYHNETSIHYGQIGMTCDSSINDKINDKMCGN